MKKKVHKQMISQSKKFGILFFVVFLIIGFWPLLSFEKIRIWSLFIALFFLLASIFKPSILEPLNKLWIKLGELLGRFIAPIIMSLIFFVILTPISILIKIFQKDILKLKLSKKDDSYWSKRQKNIGSMDKQY